MRVENDETFKIFNVEYSNVFIKINTSIKISFSTSCASVSVLCETEAKLNI
jgi:hypothetical protein